MSSIITIEVWRLLGIGFFVCAMFFGLGAMVGKEIGWKHAKNFFAPDIARGRNSRRRR